MENFRVGDFIRLKNMADFKIDRFINKDVNVFEILKIDDSFILVSKCKNQVSFSDIEPIPINGKDDLQIYYDPLIMAPFVERGEPTPISMRDYSYYLDAFKRSRFNDKNLNEIILSFGFKYVHEIQHYLSDELKQDCLKINAI